MKRKQQRPRRMRVGKRMIAAWEWAQQFDALCFDAAPDEFGPFFGYPERDAGDEESEDGEPQVVRVDDEDGDSESQEGDTKPDVVFASEQWQSKEVKTYYRGFSSVSDYCAQPFANPANADLFRDEMMPDGKTWPSAENKDKSDTENSFVPKENFTNEGWYGAATSNEAAERAFKGWPEGAEKARRMMEDIEAPAPVDLRRRINRSDQGDELDIHSVYRGNLEKAWTRRRRATMRARMTARIVTPLGGSKITTQEQMFWRGAAVLKLSELLEESGYRVEIVGVNAHFVDGHECQTINTFAIKEAGAQLDSEQVAGVICNAGFFRTWGFRDAYCTVEHELRGTQYERQYENVRVNGKWKQVPKINPQTGKQRVWKRALMARSYINAASEAIEKLQSDGTKTFVAPHHMYNARIATQWVRDCIKKLEENGEERELAEQDA